MRAALFAQFGDFPIRLEREKHLAALEAMGNVARAYGQGDTPFQQLIEHLRKYHLLEVTEK